MIPVRLIALSINCYKGTIYKNLPLTTITFEAAKRQKTKLRGAVASPDKIKFMRKILFALGNNHLSETAFEFIKKINAQEAIVVTGMYIPAFLNDLQWVTPGGDAMFVPRLVEEDEAIVRGNIIDFKEACTDNHISYRIASDSGESALADIHRETRFSDLLVIGLDNYYQKEAEVYAEEELQKILENAECPVLIVPAGAAFPEHTIIAYDGSEDSVFALKMFTYIFPSIIEQQTSIIYASAHASTLPDNSLIKELATCHFSRLGFSLLEFNPKKYLATWLEEYTRSILVAGAYGRSELSQLFKRSFIHDLLEQHPVPVFVAHK